LSKFIQVVRAVTVLKAKPKTEVLRRNRTTVFWRPCDLEFQKMAQPGHKCPQTTA